MDLLSFPDAEAATRDASRHLLLGNGFSIGAHRAFGYPSLHASAVRRDPTLAALFPEGCGSNFEQALEAAGDADDAGRLRHALIRAVAHVHPATSLRLSEDDGRQCRAFLQHFIGRDRKRHGSVFTSNYDLLLHWVLSRQEKSPGTKQHTQLKWYDGFESRGEWSDVASANVTYLHGAVHIYQRPYNSLRRKFYTEMLRYGATSTPLMKQVAALLSDGDLPVFVAEGSAREKCAAMRQRDYLKAARKRFERVCAGPQNVLFTYGHSFGESDSHLGDWIARGSIGAVYVGAFSTEDEQRVDHLSEIWTAARRAARPDPLAVYGWDARRYQVWPDH